jgi:hypothetical protein
MMKTTQWFEREFRFGLTPGMLPFFIERLSYTAMRMEYKVDGVSDKNLSEKIDGKWSVKQNIGHLAEVDEIAMKRIDEMLSGKPVLSPAVFEPRKDYNSMSVADVIGFFKKCRATNLEIYKGLAEVDLTKASLHPRLKVMMNPVDLAMFDAEHDDHHLVKINEILKRQTQ